MKIFLLLLLTPFFIHTAYAQEKIKEPPYPLTDTNFDKLKERTISFIAKRELILKEEKICVKNSTYRKSLEACLQNANETRRTINQDIKSKIQEKQK